MICLSCVFFFFILTTFLFVPVLLICCSNCYTHPSLTHSPQGSQDELAFGFGCTQHIWTFPGYGLNLSCICHLSHSCSNAGPFNPLCWAGARTCVPEAPEVPQIPLHHSGSSCSSMFYRGRRMFQNWMPLIVTQLKMYQTSPNRTFMVYKSYFH